MAITKIMCMKAAKQANVAAHLKHAIEYICNEAKTENGSLVGGINCLPDFAFEQMVGTKEMFGHTGGRQGYHFVISLLPGEGTKEQMFEMMKRFAEEFLGGEYEAVYSVHMDKEHLHGHLVFNSVNMITGKKYAYNKGDWKYLIQPITNRLCEEYGLSIVEAEYSKNPVNMNRKQWENEQSWSDFIRADMQYCRGKAKSYDEFLFLMEKLGYEVKMGAHIAVRAEAMRRSKRLDTIDEEFSVQNLQKYFEEKHYHYEYAEPPVYHPGYALMRKPKGEFQQRFYGKLYRMCVVQKCRFQYKYTRYQQDLIRMQELQQEYLFLHREGINGWADVFRAEAKAKEELVDIDAKKQELYREHARYKYQYEKDGDATVYLYHEAHYREQLEELKGKRKEIKSTLATIKRCEKESVYAHMEIPLDVDIENLFMVDVPEYEDALDCSKDDLYEGVCVNYADRLDYADNTDNAEYVGNNYSGDVEKDTSEELSEEITDEILMQEPPTMSVEKTDATDDMDTFTDEEVMQLYELLSSNNEPVMEEFKETEMTKERYETLTDKEKVEWLGISDYEAGDAIRVFVDKLESIGISYRYTGDMLDEFMRLEVVAKEDDKFISCEKIEKDKRISVK